MKEIVSAAIVVLGWIVAHYLTLRAQRIGFQNQLVDRARMEIARSIHAYEKWLGLFVGLCFSIEREVSDELAGDKPSWIRFQDDVRALADDLAAFSEWNLNLQEYEILFPETRALREELLRRNMIILGNRNSLQEFIDRTQPQLAPLKERQEIAKWAKEHVAFAAEQASLLRQLRVHLQNKSPSQIFYRQRVPLPSPRSEVEVAWLKKRRRWPADDRSVSDASLRSAEHFSEAMTKLLPR